jgi:inner membrane protein
MMDSITQAALGAAVGEAALGRKAGYRAALMGAVMGTIPDLDVLANPLMDEITQLGWHRGYSHSIIVNAALGPILAWVLYKIYGRYASRKQWMLLAWLVLFTHIGLDCFTLYGTQLFLPFSNYMVEFRNIAIIDPVYTVPLLIGVLVALFLRRSSMARRWVNYTGLAVSSLYLLITVGIKFHVGSVVKQSLDRQGVSYQRYMTAPTLFNAVLWRATIHVDDGYWIGYYSLFDSDETIEWRHIPRNGELIDPYKETRGVRQLLWFSNGYYAVTKEDGQLRFHDLRFGEIQIDYNRPGRFIFTWDMNISDAPSGTSISISRPDFAFENTAEAFDALLARIKGT